MTLRTPRFLLAAWLSVACATPLDEPLDAGRDGSTLDADVVADASDDARTVDAEIVDARLVEADAPHDAALDSFDVGPPPPPPPLPLPDDLYAFPEALTFCVGREVSPPPCGDGVRNGDELGIDCGGRCGVACSSERTCRVDSECGANELCLELLCAGTRRCPRVCIAARDTCDESSCATRCRSVTTSDGRRTALCEPVHAVGQSCRDDAMCGVDAHCASTDPDRPRLETFECMARPAAGEPCEEGECADGWACVAGRCAPPGLEGAACARTSECDATLHCEAGACTARRPVGAACTGTRDDRCVLGATCATPGSGLEYRCACVGRVGEPCVYGSCANDATCELPPGECESWFDCAGGDCCMVDGAPRCVRDAAECAIPTGTCRERALRGS
jgi:hypothetical protein